MVAEGGGYRAEGIVHRDCQEYDFTLYQNMTKGAVPSA